MEKFCRLALLSIYFLSLSIPIDGNNRVLLTTIQTLTFHLDRYTTSRRGKPLKQLDCRGDYCHQASIYSAQCYNRGTNGDLVQWECKADLPSSLKFANLDVSCEGYDYSGDPYILADSCGLIFSLRRVDGSKKDHGRGYPMKKKSSDDSSSSLFSWFPIVFVILIIVFIYYKCLKNNNSPNQPPNRPAGGGPYYGGGGGPGGHGGPGGPSAPPPPGFRTDFYDDPVKQQQQHREPPPPYSQTYDQGNNPGWNQNRYGQNPQASRSGGFGSNMLPGMLGGMAAGGLMGYLFGNRSRNDTPTSMLRNPRSSSWVRPDDDYDCHGGEGIFTTGSSNDSDGVEEAVGFSSTSIR